MKISRLSILVFAKIAVAIDTSYAGCRENADCHGRTTWGGRPVPFCDTEVHLCVGCINDADCEDNEICLSPYGTCYNKHDFLGDKCRDTEMWCKYEPNCDIKDVQEKCPKFCKVCKGDTSEMPSNCTDMNPPEYCKKKAIGMDRFLLRDNHCNITLMNWIEKLSEKEVCYDNDMMPEKNTRMDDIDDRMEPCTDHWTMNPLHQCTTFLKKLDKYFNRMEKNCSMTAGIMAKHLTTIKKPDCLLKGQD